MPDSATEPLFSSRCEYGWGDFRCQKQDCHDDKHALVWNGDEDDE